MAGCLTFGYVAPSCPDFALVSLLRFFLFVNTFAPLFFGLSGSGKQRCVKRSGA